MAWSRVLSALPDAALGVTFLVTWARPDLLGDTAVARGVVTMLLEFVIVHSAAFMGTLALSDRPAGRKVQELLGLGVFYSLLVFGFAASTGQGWVLIAFWLLTLNRLTGVIFHTAPTGDERLAAHAGWAMSTMLYLAGVAATVLLPLPAWGVTRALPGDTSGLWASQPHRALAFGVFYFLAQAWFELRPPQWLIRPLRSQYPTTPTP